MTNPIASAGNRRGGSRTARAWDAPLDRGHDPDVHRRKSVRLRGYDYSQAGAYFVTIVTQGRECLFGDVVGDTMQLNGAGRLARAAWEGLPRRFPGIGLDVFVVMPNHVHGIIVIDESVGASLVGAQDGDDAGMSERGRATMGIGGMERATTRVAPTGSGDAACEGADVFDESVGASLVGAQGGDDAGMSERGRAATGDGGMERATTRIAPTGCGDDIGERERATTRVAPTLGDVVGAYKSIVTVEYARGVRANGWRRFRGRLWQRNYYEHVIRDEREFHLAREYIVNNPLQWSLDRENPDAHR